MPTWDIFHTDRFEVESGLSPEAVRSGIASGSIRPDDLARPSGSGEPWGRVDARPELVLASSEAEPPSVEKPTGREQSDVNHLPSEDLGDRPDARSARPVAEDEASGLLDPDQAAPQSGADDDRTVELRRSPTTPPPAEQSTGEDDRDDLAVDDAGAMPSPDFSAPDAPPVAVEEAPAFPPIDEDEAFDPLDEDDEAAAFTLAAEPTTEPDEIDLTAMVDVAFQLVLFFLVTATTIYFKTLEIPTPEPEDPDAVAQQMRTLDELLEEYILVEIDPQGRVQVDGEPIPPEELTPRLRQVRSDTLRTGMLLMADFTTPHRNAVLAVDSANAIGLEIAIARPSAPAE